jgi:uncharacterized integral membrane protein
MAYSPADPTKRSQPNAFLRALGATPEHGVDKNRVIALIVIIVVLLLIVQNTGSTELHFLIFSFRAPVLIMAIVTLILGAVGWELVKRSRQRHKELGARASAAPQSPPPPPPPSSPPPPPPARR